MESLYGAVIAEGLTSNFFTPTSSTFAEPGAGLMRWRAIMHEGYEDKNSRMALSSEVASENAVGAAVVPRCNSK